MLRHPFEKIITGGFDTSGQSQGSFFQKNKKRKYLDYEQNGEMNVEVDAKM
ncbi:conserved hypothetical protein [delta proteobacterium NaphS2]|nr:conserved hypothetical protein [delta proteobacterium NaphS2]